MYKQEFTSVFPNTEVKEPLKKKEEEVVGGNLGMHQMVYKNRAFDKE